MPKRMLQDEKRGAAVNFKVGLDKRKTDKNNKGWQTFGQYMVRTLPEGYSLLSLRAILKSPKTLEKDKLHIARWTVGSETRPTSETFSTGWKKDENPEQAPNAFVRDTYSSQWFDPYNIWVMYRQVGSSKLKSKIGHWQVTVKPKIHRKYKNLMIYGGHRKLIVDDNAYLQMKLGQSKLANYFSFYSTNGGVKHYGRSGLYTLSLTDTEIYQDPIELVKEPSKAEVKKDAKNYEEVQKPLTKEVQAQQENLAWKFKKLREHAQALVARKAEREAAEKKRKAEAAAAEAMRKAVLIATRKRMRAENAAAERRKRLQEAAVAARKAIKRLKKLEEEKRLVDEAEKKRLAGIAAVKAKAVAEANAKIAAEEAAKEKAAADADAKKAAEEAAKKLAMLAAKAKAAAEEQAAKLQAQGWLTMVAEERETAADQVDDMWDLPQDKKKGRLLLNLEAPSSSPSAFTALDGGETPTVTYQMPWVNPLVIGMLAVGLLVAIIVGISIKKNVRWQKNNHVISTSEEADVIVPAPDTANPDKE